MRTKIFLYLSTVLFLIGQSNGQSNTSYNTLQRVVPPSPEAGSLQQVNYSDVNLYAGKASYSLPVYTISQNGINFPVALSYTGGGGIKVEEIGSSVGLGWNLSSTGVISRVIRGIADDESGGYMGYINLPTFPDINDINNYDVYNNYYSKNKYDAQPDIYSLSVAGMAAQFYINKNKKVVFIEKSDLVITPVFSGYAISAFEVKSLDGKRYYFSEQEKTKTVNLDGSFAEYQPFSTTSWYLTKITSEYGTDILTFSYLSGENNESTFYLRAPHQYALGDSFLGEDNTSWSQQFYKKPQLQKILFASGEVIFKTTDWLRYDIGNDKAIEKIIIKSYSGDTIKQFNFNYSYFTSNGVIQQGQSTPNSVGQSDLRLKLDSVQEISSTNQTLTYRFVYNTSKYLPDRLTSFAIDHWGYYNGQTGNTGWEANHRVKYYFALMDSTYSNWDSVYTEFGTANRTPDLTYARAGVLEKIIMPTGGELQFNYELNNSSDPSLTNNLWTSNTWYYPTTSFTTNYFTVSLINEPFAYVRISSLINSNSYSYEYFIKDSMQTREIAHDTLIYGDANHQYKLATGKYCIMQRRLGENSDQGYQYFTRLYKDEESYLPNKPVGGLRIRAMEMYDPVKETTTQRNYFYNEAGDTSISSLSTGTISGAPQYGRQSLDYFGSTPTENGLWAPNGYWRQISSFYPLGVTSGSFVGYRKVTVIDSNVLKTENYFTSFTDFPEMADGYYTNSLSKEDGGVINGQWYEKEPFAPTDERDFLRGKLTKQVIYKKEGGSFLKIRQTENSYAFNMGFALSDNKIKLPDTMDTLGGMVFLRIPNSDPTLTPEIRLKKFTLYTTKYDLKKIIQKDYSYQDGGIDSLVTETNIEYGDSPWNRDSLYHYQPTKITKSHSTGKQITTIYYPYDWKYGVPNASTDEIDNMKVLDTSNRIAMPVLQVVTDSLTNNHLSSVKNTYSALVHSKLAVNIVKLKQGQMSSFEDRLSFNKYDTLGNLIEQQKTGNIKSNYIWDYRNSYPIAEIINADSAAVAYTSFEAENKGNWMFIGSPLSDATAITGKRSYLLSNGNISKSGLSTSATYYVTYWSKNGQQNVNSISGIAGLTKNGWTYYEHKLINPAGGTVTVSGSGTIDELRLYPAGAQMTTYTYEPLVGITSQTDPNSNITYFEYDGFQRLLRVRDADKNILKQYDYQYQTYTNSSSVWQATGNMRCKPCPANAGYITNMQQHEERDINPQSSTYNTTQWVDDGISGSCVISPDWQNISSVYCQQSGGQNTGYQVQDKKDINPCSATYNNTRTDTIGYNTTSCPLPTQNATITATTYPRITGFTAKYTNVSTGQVYTLTIAYVSGTQTIGTIPAGTYNLVISKTSNSTTYYFESGCSGQSYTGTSATFNNISVSTSTCHSIIIDARL